ncbi:hypothetical protein [Methylorubrum extorquens]|uniref:hypothetical protein n=1 Tax=Methylorubrum extorquens TaxID=408 RepID=UPI0020A1B607|nr:hypothetical protein [Methylorubrum extorquens]MCP1539536.1 hypothetical protein [Methylorubrum extorquens]
MVAIHEGSTVWPSPTALGIGQHAGNQLVFRRVEARSPTSSLGFHNNVGWTWPCSVLVEDCRLTATNTDGQAISVVSCGAGIVSPVTVSSTTLNGTVVHICTFLNGAPLSAHKANRYEYDLNFEACTPVDWFWTCDVNALALSSVAGPASSVALSGPLFDILFGARPDVRKGASDLAALAYSHHAVDVPTGEVDPGVGLGVRAGDFSAAPLSGTIVFGGTITGDKNYTAFSNSGVLSDPNAKLSLAMGGSTGGRAFSLAKPYVNRAPISQHGREALAVNADTATILKGNTLAWSGRAVRLMTPADSLDLLAGVALNDSVAGERTRFLRSGFIG